MSPCVYTCTCMYYVFLSHEVVVFICEIRTLESVQSLSSYAGHHSFSVFVLFGCGYVTCTYMCSTF